MPESDEQPEIKSIEQMFAEARALRNDLATVLVEAEQAT